MQNLAKNASILLWSIFLSMMIIIAFMSINFSLSKNLENSSYKLSQIDINNEINQLINSGFEQNLWNDHTLSNGDKIIFEKDNIITIGLKKEEELHIKIQDDKSSNVTIKIIEGAPINYYNNSIEGTVSKQETFNTIDGEITIKNLGGYTNLQITSENKFEKNTKRYKIIKNLQNRTIIFSTNEILLK